MPADKDEQQHFTAMLGNCLDNARLGRFDVRVELVDGSLVHGTVGDDAMQGAAEYDHTGMSRQVHIGDRVVAVADVRRYSITRPG